MLLWAVTCNLGWTATTPTVLVLGDSLSAAYGLDLQNGWVQQLNERLKREGYVVRLVNASVSGETSLGGAQRLPAILQRDKPQVVVIELGANDALRGLSLTELGQHLTAMIQRARQQGAQVLLIGIDLPDNYGEEYRHALKDVYRTTARDTHVELVPNLLSQVPLKEANFQADHLHPTAAMQINIVNAVIGKLKPLLPSSARP
jgi:acyl-CoA thioesterase I